MDCGPDNKAFRRFNAIHLLLIGTPYPLVLRNSRVNEKLFDSIRTLLDRPETICSVCNTHSK